MKTSKWFFSCFVLGWALTAAALAADSEQKAKEDGRGKSNEKTEKTEKKVYTVTKKPLQKTVKLKGVFEAAKMYPIAVRLKEWSTLEVISAVPHGKRVKKGSRLAVFDTSKLDKAIQDLELEQRLGQLSYKQMQADLKSLEQTVPLDREAAARSRRIAREELERFLKVNRRLSEKSAAMSLKSARNALSYQQEELRQLEKMYKADDLTEETEEIILKRQRDVVEQAKFRVEEAEVRHDETLRVALPRREHSLKEAARRQEIAYAQAQATAAIKLQKARLELEKLAYEQRKRAQRLADLKADRKAMEVAAPRDGIVYYGQPTGGTWPDVNTLETKLRPGGRVTPKEVFMTVVEPRPLSVRVTVPEAELGGLRRGLRAAVVPSAFPETRLPGRIVSVGTAPVASGKFEARVAVELDKGAPPITPGMACTVRVVTYQNPHALTVPAKAVFREETLEERPYVYVQKVDGKTEKRFVEGRKVGDAFEIRRGLKAGDKVLGVKPEDAS